MSELSARGTRLNKRGLESRQKFIDTAIKTLARGDREPVSANLIARRAGFTWGAVQHLFGDADGVWAATATEIVERFRVRGEALPERDPSIHARVAAAIDVLCDNINSPESRAMMALLAILPRSTTSLRARYPKTARVIAKWRKEWNTGWDALFAGLPVSKRKLHDVRALAPAVVEGLRVNEERHGPRGVDRATLVNMLVAYLEA